MTKYDIPRDKEGRRLCEHCLTKPVPASLGTKPRRYCSRNCRQRAYEARKTGRAIREAVAVESRRRTSRDKEAQKTRDVPGVTSSNEKEDKPQPPAVKRGGRRGSTRTVGWVTLPLEGDE